MEALAWIDLETTGLDVENGLILEFAVIITDMSFRELYRGTSLCPTGDRSIIDVCDSCDEFVVDMHNNNGLWDDLSSYRDTFPTQPVSYTDVRLYNVFTGIKEEHGITQLHPAGSSIHFDVAWIKHHCPNAYKELHYRQLDVTSLKLAYQIDNGSYEKDSKTAHRAMADIEQSLAYCKQYLFGSVPEENSVEVEAARILHQIKVSE